MADLGDQAQEREEMHREAALAAFRSRVAPEPSNECRGCKEPIPEERRQVSKSPFCVYCQEELEHK